MGYTHYWRGGNIIDGRWSKAITDCDTIVAAGADAYKIDKKKSVNDSAIWVNGREDLEADYEDFVVSRDHEQANGTDFDFCKTQHRPYDTVVVACLCVLAEAGLSVTSDGYRSEWKAGAEHATHALGRPVAIPAAIEDDPE